jgi:hypothetical protein
MGFTSFIIYYTVPYSCLLSRMCNAKADCGLLFLMYRVCFWYLCFSSLLVCPMYLCLHVLHVSAYIPLHLYFCVLLVVSTLVIRCTLLLLLKAMFISVCLKRFVIFLI